MQHNEHEALELSYTTRVAEKEITVNHLWYPDAENARASMNKAIVESSGRFIWVRLKKVSNW